MRDGHLFLSLKADGGIYEFEPMSSDGTQTGSAAAVRGTAFYRERIALPPNAVFEATLEDISRAGAAAELVARVRNEQPGYAVRGRVLVGNNVWFYTDRNYPVITAGRGSDVQLLLRRAGTSIPTGRVPPAPSTAALENTYWKLMSVGNTPVRVASQQREPNFILHPENNTVTGSGGCNRLTGTYSLRSDRITFNRVASTMMACVDGMDTEQAYLRALGSAYRWRINGQQLDLLDSAGNTLARFEAVYM